MAQRLIPFARLSFAAAFVFAITACGAWVDRGSGGGAGAKDKSQDVAAGLDELQTTPPSAVPSLISAFGIEADFTAGGFVAFYTGDRFFSGVVQRTSTMTYRIEGTIGHYAQDGGHIHTQRERTTCRALSAKYPTATQVDGTTSGQSLVLTRDSRSVVVTRLNVNPNAHPDNGFVIDWGCFDEQTGTFTAEGWSTL